MNHFDWVAAHDLAQATRAADSTVASAMIAPQGQVRSNASILKGGGIDLLDLMKEGLLAPRRLVNLREISGLDRIEQNGEGLRIGAMVTLARIAADPTIRARYRALADAAGASASPEIRAVATIGGNLLQRPRCWYFRSAAHYCARKGGSGCYAFGGENQYHAIFDHHGCAIVHPSTAATALVALGAKLEVVNAEGKTRVVGLEQFFVLPDTDIHRENDLQAGEIVTAVLLPGVPQTLRSVHVKQGETDSFDWPLADVAVVLDFTQTDECSRASIVLGAAAPTPKRAVVAEELLVGKIVDASVARNAGRAALIGAEPLSKNAYKLKIFEALVSRALIATTARR